MQETHFDSDVIVKDAHPVNHVVDPEHRFELSSTSPQWITDLLMMQSKRLPIGTWEFEYDVDRAGALALVDAPDIDLKTDDELVIALATLFPSKMYRDTKGQLWVQAHDSAKKVSMEMLLTNYKPGKVELKPYTIAALLDIVVFVFKKHRSCGHRMFWSVLNLYKVLRLPCRKNLASAK